jgi:DNA repair exonuclease SbcCD nuclease subunit
LGYKQFPRLTPVGRNQREQDVSDTFAATVQRCVELAPDLIVVAGDVFHMTRPSNWALMDAAEGFKRLARELPNAETVVIAGNHDENRINAEGPILRLLKYAGVRVVYGKDPVLLTLNSGHQVACVPERAVNVPTWRAWAAPSRTLVLHGEIRGAIPNSPEEHAIDLDHSEWGYVALGHYHVRSDLWSNGGYSGSLDYVSTDIWGESRDGVPKGFLEYDTETRRRTFHATAPRRVVDLPVLDCTGWTRAKIEAACLAALEFAGGEGAVVRQVVTGLTKTEWRGLNWRRFPRQVKAGCIVYQMDPRFAEKQKSPLSPEGYRDRMKSLDQLVAEYLGKRILPEGLDRGEFAALGLRYLTEAKETAIPEPS